MMSSGLAEVEAEVRVGTEVEKVEVASLCFRTTN